MAVEYRQICDSCGGERKVAGSEDRDLQKDGWRQLPLQVRHPYPWCCPPCLRAIQQLIDEGKVKEVRERYASR